MKPVEGMMIDDRNRGVFRVNRACFLDQRILEMERAQIFENCWLYVGHESEIPAPGDYRLRRVGGNPIIFVHGDDDQIRVLQNTCTHRGAQVCRGPNAGNNRSFQCSYHAWTYNNKGELIGVPGESAYSDAFCRADFALKTPPRVASYRGFVFTSFNPAIEDLSDYLAGAKEYLDLMTDYAEQGLEVVEGTQEYSMRANWKLLVENSMDGYHLMGTHHRYVADFMGMKPSSFPMNFGRSYSLGNGHAVMLSGSGLGPLAKSAKAELEAKRQRLEARFGAERTSRMMAGTGNLLIFPNLIIIDSWKTVRTFYPTSPDYVEITAWALMPKEDSPELRHKRIQNFLSFLGPGGFATPDDVEGLESCARGFANRNVEWSDISRGMKNPTPYTTDELQMRVFWRRWHELMTGRTSANYGDTVA